MDNKRKRKDIRLKEYDYSQPVILLYNQPSAYGTEKNY